MRSYTLCASLSPFDDGGSPSPSMTAMSGRSAWSAIRGLLDSPERTRPPYGCDEFAAGAPQPRSMKVGR